MTAADYYDWRERWNDELEAHMERQFIEAAQEFAWAVFLLGWERLGRAVSLDTTP